MVNIKSTFVALAALSLSVGPAMAYTGRGRWALSPPLSQLILLLLVASWDALGTTPCPKACTPNLDYRVALPVTMFPNGEHCCERVHIQCAFGLSFYTARTPSHLVF